MQFLILALALSSCFLQIADAQPTNLKVQLSIFSGRRDPQWNVTPSTPNYANIMKAYNHAKNAGTLQSYGQIQSKLGYRGFVISEDGNTRDFKTLKLVVGSETKRLQMLLLESVPKRWISPFLTNIIKKSIGQEAQQTILNVKLPIFSGRRDPQWRVTPSTSNYVNIIKAYKHAKNAGMLLPFGQIQSKLGYRGFVISEDVKTLKLVAGRKTKRLQMLLLKSAPKTEISGRIIKSICRSIRKQS